MTRHFPRLAVPVLVATVAALAMVAAATPAAARAAAPAAAPGWRIFQVLPDMTVDGSTALGAADAWLTGDSCSGSQCDRDTLIVRHWDGKAWRVVTPPKAFTGSPVGQGAGPVAATSASNAWIFAYRGKGEIDYTDALHWTGKGWAAPVELGTMIDAAVAPSATDVWAFGAPATSRQAGYVAHYNGKTWTQASFPITGTFATALSANDIWVAGEVTGAAGTAARIEHWNGHVWRDTPLPDLGVGGVTLALIEGIAAVSARDVWADIGVAPPPCCSLSTGSEDLPGTFLLHWNGTAWARAAFPYAGTAVTPVVSDGHGGIWLTIDVGSGSSSKLWFCHDSDGRWSRTAVPTERGEQPDVLYLNWVPGTRSLWAAGPDSADDGSSILKYGP